MTLLLSTAEAGAHFFRYLRRDLRTDAVAGLTVAVMGVPQAMAYALIAGLPPAYGLYTAIITCTVAAILGSSSHLVTGPTNALCMVLLSLTAHLPEKYGIGIIEATLLLTFMTGVIQLGFGLLKMGGIVRYVSNSVVVGFTAGAGILIAANQLKNILGVDISGTHAERFYEVVLATILHLPETNPVALGLGVLTAAAAVWLPRVHPRIPGSLIGVVGAAGLVFWFGWFEPAMDRFRVDIVRDIEPISGSLRVFHLPALLAAPNYELTRELGTGALALAILGLIEAASIARAVAAQSGQRLDFTRDFIGQGTSNIVGSFFSCFAGSGSFTRTAVCFQSGGRTRLAAVFSAGWTALTLLLLGPFANYIPKASLAGILIVVAYSMVDKHRLRLTWRSGKNSQLVMGGTLAATLVLPLEYAIFVGVFLSIVLLLRITGKTDLTQLVPRSDSGFDEVPFQRAAPSPVVIVNLEGDLYFAAVEDLDYELLRCLTPETRVVVLRMKRLRAVGSTAMAILEHFWKVLDERGVYLVVCGIEDELKDVMTGSGLRRQIGEPNIFYADNKLFQSTELALARAWSVVEMEKRRTAPTPAEAPAAAAAQVTAADIMTRRCIRFGNQHQLREATWLMSEMQKHTRQPVPQPLFLQDREGKLFGKLTTWRILKEMTGEIDPATDLSDRQLVSQLRRNFDRSITDLAETDLARLDKGSGLAAMTMACVDRDETVLPVCDEHDRIMGMVDQAGLVKGIGQVLHLEPDEVLKS